MGHLLAHCAQISDSLDFTIVGGYARCGRFWRCYVLLCRDVLAPEGQHEAMSWDSGHLERGLGDGQPLLRPAESRAAL